MTTATQTETIREEWNREDMALTLTSEAIGYRIHRQWIGKGKTVVAEFVRMEDGWWLANQYQEFESYQAVRMGSMWDELEANLRRDHEMMTRPW